MIRRLYVEKRPSFRDANAALLADLRDTLGLTQLTGLRQVLRYDVEGVADEAAWQRAVPVVFAEAPVDVARVALEPEDASVTFAVEFLPGQFDQRADSAAQCLQLLLGSRPTVATATVYLFAGELDKDAEQALKKYLINPVDSRLAALQPVPETLRPAIPEPAPVATLTGFMAKDGAALAELHAALGLAMSAEDLAFCQRYFRDEAQRDPTLTEIKLLDTYWSDHCRHTTFLTELEDVTFGDSPADAPVKAAWEDYQRIRAEVHADPAQKPVCLMDLAVLAAKHLRKTGQLDDLEVSEEVNAASIVVEAEIEGRTEEWLVMFKNETHNHPTEIEPFGGAATCLGGAIRDPLSGRSYVYQAMRVTGAADPRTPFGDTIPGKLPQRVITREAARGYSSYGNQIGLATGQVHELYHPGYVAKRMEVGAVIAAAPRDHVRREEPTPGDVILLVGGRTGRDGVGGATGSSKAHDTKALENAAEVQKGDPPTERKLQRLFRDRAVARLIKRCNDFGAGGVAVAIGELAPSLAINLDAVPKKYAGLDGTELALSESQERMAVVLEPNDVAAFQAAAAAENLDAVAVATVTDDGFMRMTWRDQTVAELRRDFLDTAGVRQHQKVDASLALEEKPSIPPVEEKNVSDRWQKLLSSLPQAAQTGLIERFDASIGAGTVLHPLGGRHQMTPVDAMAALLPPINGESSTATLMSFGFDPALSVQGEFYSAAYAVLTSVTKIVASGGDPARVHLTFQEYFPHLGQDPSRWGMPLRALLGAWAAQRGLGLGAVGGKDSMSGSFGELDVPPTLISFAVAPVAATRVISPEFKAAGERIVHLPCPRDAHGLPQWTEAKAQLAAVSAMTARGDITAAKTLGAGGLAEALALMAFGNSLGVKIHESVTIEQLFAAAHGDLLFTVADDSVSLPPQAREIGEVTTQALVEGEGWQVPLDSLLKAWQAPLEKVFPTTLAANSLHKVSDEGQKNATRPRNSPRRLTGTQKHARPRVVIPTFPGTNCEYDSARIFAQAGAVTHTPVFCNLTDAAVEASTQALAEAIDRAQILFLPGGFSAGDEPAGSGKFIAAVFRHPRVTEATMRLLRERDGLILGICNGFQALIKLGLLPHGEIRDLSPDDPTLTHNTLGRHVSRYIRTRIVTTNSPWLATCAVGEEHVIPVSHGEGRFMAAPEVIAQFTEQDQIATQYVDAKGEPTLALPANPNGSVAAIEGLLSPCGRVFGKMGHSERVGPQVAKNIPGAKIQPIFTAGVGYFA